MAQQFELELLPFTTRDLLAEVRTALFPNLKAVVEVGYARFDSVAYIQKQNEGSWLICINTVLNHPDTPPEIIRYILTHELLHIEVRPRRLSEAEWRKQRHPRRIREEKMQQLLQRECAHPPEFFARQQELIGSPDLQYAWIAALTRGYYKIDFENEKFTLKPGVYKAVSNQRRITLAELDELTDGVVLLD